ncbi:MAG TPA: FliH/SctL family protein [Candidatus Baltobacteraceae bacterium]|nr:FliH/SctL family protein [Candidatus Baltobacteraceae bacterium]
MPDGFQSLAQWLTPKVQVADDIVNAPQAEELSESCDARVPDMDVALSELRRFRAALADAIDETRERLLREIAVDVVARELELCDADIDAVIERACERYAIDVPVAVRLHPGDAATVHLAYPVIEDATLRRGDAIVEASSGTIDARLGVRLERVLRALA